MNRTASLWAAGLAGALRSSPAPLRADGHGRQAGARRSRAPTRRAAAAQPRRLQGQVGRARVGEPRVPVRAEALRQRQHAEDCRRPHRQGRRLALGQLVGAGQAGRHGRRRSRRSSRPRTARRPPRVLLDPDGAVGHAYGAKTTPHMFVIDPKGTLVYAGAIDDKPSTDQADVPIAKNYVLAALDEAHGRQAGDGVLDAAVRLQRQVRDGPFDRAGRVSSCPFFFAGSPPKACRVGENPGALPWKGRADVRRQTDRLTDHEARAARHRQRLVASPRPSRSSPCAVISIRRERLAREGPGVEAPKCRGRRSPRRAVREQDGEAVGRPRGRRWDPKVPGRARCPSDLERSLGVIGHDLSDRSLPIENRQRVPLPHSPKVPTEVGLEVSNADFAHDLFWS